MPRKTVLSSRRSSRSKTCRRPLTSCKERWSPLCVRSWRPSTGCQACSSRCSCSKRSSRTPLSGLMSTTWRTTEHSRTSRTSRRCLWAASSLYRRRRRQPHPSCPRSGQQWWWVNLIMQKHRHWRKRMRRSRRWCSHCKRSWRRHYWARACSPSNLKDHRRRVARR